MPAMAAAAAVQATPNDDDEAWLEGLAADFPFSRAPVAARAGEGVAQGEQTCAHASGGTRPVPTPQARMASCEVDGDDGADPASPTFPQRLIWRLEELPGVPQQMLRLMRRGDWHCRST